MNKEELQEALENLEDGYEHLQYTHKEEVKKLIEEFLESLKKYKEDLKHSWQSGLMGGYIRLTDFNIWIDKEIEKWEAKR